MYAKLEEVTLVQDKSKRRSDDPVMYIRQFRNETILTPLSDPASNPRYGMGEATRYGTMYYDANETLCVIPDEWNEEHAQQAKLALTLDYYG